LRLRKRLEKQSPTQFRKKTTRKNTKIQQNTLALKNTRALGLKIIFVII